MLIPRLGRWLLGAAQESRVFVQVDGRFCVRQRHRRASCRRCAEACPAHAIGLDQGPMVVHERCTGCGLCATLCPTGALEMLVPTDQTLLGRLVEAAREGSPTVVGCGSYLKRLGAPAPGVVRVACLGRLDLSLLLAGVAWGERPIQLVEGGCQGCSHAAGRQAAGESVRLANGLLEACGTPRRVSFVAKPPSAGEGSTPSAPVDGVSRRELLGMLVGKGAQSPAEGLTGLPALEKPPAQTGPARGEVAAPQFVPAKRQLLLAALRRFPVPVGPRPAPGGGPWARFTFDDRCNGCRMCAFFCPTGALRKTDLDGQPALAFTPSLCTGCGLCQEICFRQAVSLSPELDLASFWDGSSTTMVVPFTGK